MYLNTIALHSSKVRHLFVGFFQKQIFVVVFVGLYIKEHLKYPTLCPTPVKGDFSSLSYSHIPKFRLLSHPPLK